MKATPSGSFRTTVASPNKLGSEYNKATDESTICPFGLDVRGKQCKVGG